MQAAAQQLVERDSELQRQEAAWQEAAAVAAAAAERRRLFARFDLQVPHLMPTRLHAGFSHPCQMQPEYGICELRGRAVA